MADSHHMTIDELASQIKQAYLGANPDDIFERAEQREAVSDG